MTRRTVPGVWLALCEYEDSPSEIIGVYSTAFAARRACEAQMPEIHWDKRGEGIYRGSWVAKFIIQSYEVMGDD